MLFGSQRINAKDHLEVGGCDTIELARQFGTPLYVVDEDAFRERCREYKRAFASRSENTQVAFATKAFLCKAAARLATEAGLHLDVASLGEMRLVNAAGVDMTHVTLHGNFKKDEDLEAAIELGVGVVAIDSIDEARRLSRIAVSRGTSQRSILRVAPGIKGQQDEKISTGQDDTKFGINIADGSALAAAKECLELPGIELVGFNAHIGSQILDVSPFSTLTVVFTQFCADVRAATDWSPQLLVCGGGLGIHYSYADDPADVGTLAELIVEGIRSGCEKHGLDLPRIGVEPGRSIIGELGLTLYEIGPIKQVPIGPGETRTYVSVDGGLSDNPRPVMYDAEYPVLLANRATEDPDTLVRIAGRHCETDTLFPEAKLPTPKTGDIVAVQSTGAYNHTMASNYNFFYRPAVVFVAGGEAREVVRRETQEDLMARELG